MKNETFIHRHSKRVSIRHWRKITWNLWSMISISVCSRSLCHLCPLTTKSIQDETVSHLSDRSAISAVTATPKLEKKNGKNREFEHTKKENKNRGNKGRSLLDHGVSLLRTSIREMRWKTNQTQKVKCQTRMQTLCQILKTVEWQVYSESFDKKK